MEIYYQDKEITEYVQVRQCIVHDTAGSRCDSLKIMFENAAVWDRWGPKEDDRLAVIQDSYDSGDMYINTVMIEEGKYSIYATSLPCKARTKGYTSFVDKTVEDIIQQCAEISGMKYQIYGIDPSAIIPYIERNNEGCAAFLTRFLTLEGAVLKCVNGKYVAIGLDFAQENTLSRVIEMTDKQKAVLYSKNGMSVKRLTVQTPYASATAEDTAVPDDHAWITDCTVPAMDQVQAGRWARGKLLHINRKSETLYMNSKFDPGLTAMINMGIFSNTNTTGQWLIEDVEHDLKERKTTTIMRRCISTVQ